MQRSWGRARPHSPEEQRGGLCAGAEGMRGRDGGGEGSEGIVDNGKDPNAYPTEVGALGGCVQRIQMFIGNPVAFVGRTGCGAPEGRRERLAQ